MGNTYKVTEQVIRKAKTPEGFEYDVVVAVAGDEIPHEQAVALGLVGRKSGDDEATPVEVLSIPHHPAGPADSAAEHQRTLDRVNAADEAARVAATKGDDLDEARREAEAKFDADAPKDAQTGESKDDVQTAERRTRRTAAAKKAADKGDGDK